MYNADPKDGGGRADGWLLPSLLDEHWQLPGVAVVMVCQLVRDAWGLLKIIHPIGEPI